MKILIDASLPFAFAHGGQQTQIEQTRSALERAGIEVEFVRWWDDRQRGDLIHFFGVPSGSYLAHAKVIKLPVVVTQLFSETCNRSTARLKRQGILVKAILAFPFGEGIKQQLAWRSVQNCEHHVVGLEAERKVLQFVYGIPTEKISIAPSGLTQAYLQAGHGQRSEPHLICTGTITQRKNSAELAEMAHAAQVPILFTGKPYHADDPYWLRFKKLIDDRWVKHQLVTYESPAAGETEMIRLLQAARGFVFMSNYENWCLSAHEAAACGLPLLVQDQNWSRERFGNQSRYFKTIGVTSENIKMLRQFYKDAPGLPAPQIKLFSWDDAASCLKNAYGRVLNASL